MFISMQVIAGSLFDHDWRLKNWWKSCSVGKETCWMIQAEVGIYIILKCEYVKLLQYLRIRLMVGLFLSVLMNFWVSYWNLLTNYHVSWKTICLTCSWVWKLYSPSSDYKGCSSSGMWFGVACQIISEDLFFYDNGESLFY